jgi:hypothetical protein
MTAMACDPCKGEGYPNEPSIGNCCVALCNLAICGPPPTRSDGKVHGEHCSCLNGCGRLFCKPHARRHAPTHGGSSGTTSCFPHLALTSSGPVLVGAFTSLARAHDAGRVEDVDPERSVVLMDSETATAIGEFLTYITPGIESFISAPLPHPLLQPLWALEILPGAHVTDQPRIHLSPAFFTTARLQRFVSLAAASFGQAWAILRERHQDGAYPSDPSAAQAWDELAVWARERGTAAVAPDVDRWLPPMRSRWAPTLEPLSMRHPSAHAVVRTVPKDEFTRALWLVTGMSHVVGRAQSVPMV